MIEMASQKIPLHRRLRGWGLASLFFLSASVPSLANFNAQDVFISIPGATFLIGDVDGDPNETPRQVSVAPFKLMQMEVTNRQFSDFVEATSHQTNAEISGSGYVWDRTWQLKKGADWRHPNGMKTSITSIMDHPVVQVSARDAKAYCAWRNFRLPSEIEWEFAAKSTDNRKFPWGNNRPSAKAKRHANFGTLECCAPDSTDGYNKTSPVGTYPSGASPFGVLDMAGNVWEWTSTSFPGEPDHQVIRGGGWGNNAYCLRTSYKHGNPRDIGLDMVGIRCATDDPLNG